MVDGRSCCACRRRCCRCWDIAVGSVVAQGCPAEGIEVGNGLLEGNAHHKVLKVGLCGSVVGKGTSIGGDMWCYLARVLGFFDDGILETLAGAACLELRSDGALSVECGGGHDIRVCVGEGGDGKGV